MRYFFVLLLSFFACDDEEKTKEITNITSSSPTSNIATSEFNVNGSLTLPIDGADESKVSSQVIEIIRNDGFLVASTTTSETGEYEFQIPSGALIIDTEYSLALTEGEDAGKEVVKATTDDFSYLIKAEVPDDGQGNAVGLRKNLDLSESNLVEGRLLLGETPLKEVTAIVGRISFENESVNVGLTDIFIPGKQFFIRTGDDGEFAMLFVPSGSYILRIQNGIYTKDIEVNLDPGKTLDLGGLVVSEKDRNPLPFADVFIGSWKTTCYFNTNMGTTIVNPKSGTLVVTALDDVSFTGDSCILRSFAAAGRPFEKFILLGDGGLGLVLSDSGGTDYYTHTIIKHDNNRIVISAENTSIANGSVIEVFERM